MKAAISAKADPVEALRAGGVHFGIDGTTKEQVIASAVALIRLPHAVDRSRILEAVMARERIMSTGLQNGIAWPHGKLPDSLPCATVCGLFYPSQPVDWNSLDGLPVTLVFLQLTDARRAVAHMELVAGIGSILLAEGFLDRLRAARTEQEVLGLMRGQAGPFQTERSGAAVGGSRESSAETKLSAGVTLGRTGLHIGPAAALLQAIDGLNVRLTIRVTSNTVLVDGEPVPVAGGQTIELDGRNPSMIELMRVPLNPGAQLLVQCEGSEAARAMSKLGAALTDQTAFEGAVFSQVP